jgi:hypothetical protein
VLSLKRERCTIIIFVENLLSDSPTRDSNNLHVGENTNMGCLIGENTNMVGTYFFGSSPCWCYRSKVIFAPLLF